MIRSPFQSGSQRADAIGPDGVGTHRDSRSWCQSELVGAVGGRKSPEHSAVGGYRAAGERRQSRWVRYCETNQAEVDGDDRIRPFHRPYRQRGLEYIAYHGHCIMNSMSL